MTRQHVLPIALSILRECKVRDLANATVAILTPDPPFREVLHGEVHALKFIVKRYVAQSAIPCARDDVPGAMHDRVVLPAIELDLERRVRMT